MTILDIDNSSFDYDARGLLTSFYPGELVLLPPQEEEMLRPKRRPWRDAQAGGSDPSGSEGGPADGKAAFRALFGPGERRVLQIRIGEDRVAMDLFLGGSPEHAVRDDAGQIRTAAAVPGTLADREDRAYDPAGGRGAVKTALKCGLYDLLSRVTGKPLPWGTLTGIRPVKLPMEMLQEGVPAEEIPGRLMAAYSMSEKKARLAVEIAQVERRLLSAAGAQEAWSLYAGIPFCPTRCAYCSFPSYPAAQFAGRMDAYLEALEKELAYFAQAMSGRRLSTIYLGGGTPTSLSPNQLDRLLGFMEERFDTSSLLEWTVEAGRPDSITPEKLAALRRHPVTRISVNPQTMKEETLRLIGRRHTVDDVRRAFHMAREAGFDNINMDLIVGLPGETAADVARTMEEIRALGPDSVTVHTLAIKRAARLNTESTDFADYERDMSEASMDEAAAACRAMGLLPYYLYRQKNMAGNLENVGFAAPGKEGVYNILIMEEVQTIAAAGAGAVTKVLFPGGRIARTGNVKEPESYIARIDEMVERKRQLLEGDPGAAATEPQEDFEE